MDDLKFGLKCSLFFISIYATIMFLATGEGMPAKWFIIYLSGLFMLWFYIWKVFTKEDWERLFSSKNEKNGTE